VAHDPKDQQEDSPVPEGGAPNRGDIDAPFAAAPDDTSPLESSASFPDGQDEQADDPTPSGEKPLDQAARDALLAGASEEDPAPEPPAPSVSEGTPTNEVSQADIDALLGGEAVEASTAMQAATDDEKGGDAPQASGAPDPPSPPTGGQAFEPFDLGQSTAPSVEPHRVSMLNDVKLRVRIELGRTRMLVEDVLKLGEGSVVELDKLAGDPVEVFVNDRLVASGEVLILNDNFCVRISEVLSNDPHRVAT
jgi:flagellar motor switch protein FliN/FliY